MPLATDRWILVNIRETWSFFSQDITLEQVASYPDAFDGWWADATEDFTIECRTPIAYLDRSNSFEGEDRASCGADSYATEQNPNEGAAVGALSWTPALPPAPPTTNGGTPTDGTWQNVKMLDNVFEHDSSNKNGIVALTQSLLYASGYVEVRSVEGGNWSPVSADLLHVLWPDQVPSP